MAQHIIDIKIGEIFIMARHIIDIKVREIVITKYPASKLDSICNTAPVTLNSNIQTQGATVK